MKTLRALPKKFTEVYLENITYVFYTKVLGCVKLSSLHKNAFTTSCLWKNQEVNLNREKKEKGKYQSADRISY